MRVGEEPFESIGRGDIAEGRGERIDGRIPEEQVHAPERLHGSGWDGREGDRRGADRGEHLGVCPNGKGHAEGGHTRGAHLDDDRVIGPVAIAAGGCGKRKR